MKIDSSLMFEPVKVKAMAPQLEEAGFDGAYTFEGQSDPFISVAAAAMTTQKMELMTSIAVAFARNPMSLAYLGNDLQNLSEGRFILGLGAQIKAHIERRFSMPWSKPASRMREMVQAIRAIWDCWDNGEKLNFEGEFYQHTLMTPMFVPPKSEHGRPPIYIAGVGPIMTEVAAEVGDGYFVHPFSTEKSDEQTMEQSIFGARSQIAFYASTPAYLPVLQCHGWDDLHVEAKRLSKEGKWMEMAGLIDDEILNTIAVVGTPAEIAQKIADRFLGKADRISPVAYAPDVELLATLCGEIRAVT
jgi:alkanesulfonate monooxygenase SsuD/methylene tetrahydromethanopterin reductase-like flavin-dependent oxidoreductase (luciferase family)